MKCERKYMVYMHRNRFNDKKYFGITCRPVNKRWRHGLGYKTQSIFYNAILKYGWDAGFDHMILAVDLTEECAKDIERLLIAVFNTQNPEFGYNLTSGGDENPMDNFVVREKYRKIIQSPEWQKKIREARQKQCKKVRCVETKIVYGSIKEAAIAVNLKHYNHIINCCKGKRKRAGGYQWEYVDEELKNKYVPYASKHKRVLCVETGVIYESVPKAAEMVGCTRGNIYGHLHGRSKTAKKFHWEYV